MIDVNYWLNNYKKSIISSFSFFYVVLFFFFFFLSIDVFVVDDDGFGSTVRTREREKKHSLRCVYVQHCAFGEKEKTIRAYCNGISELNKTNKQQQQSPKKNTIDGYGTKI